MFNVNDRVNVLRSGLWQTGAVTAINTLTGPYVPTLPLYDILLDNGISASGLSESIINPFETYQAGESVFFWDKSRWETGRVIAEKSAPFSPVIYEIMPTFLSRPFWAAQSYLKKTVTISGWIPPISTGNLVVNSDPGSYSFPVTMTMESEKTTSKSKSPSNHNCPKCNDQGEWRSMALVCRNGHGVFAG